LSLRETMTRAGARVRLVGAGGGDPATNLHAAVTEEVLRADVVHIHALWEPIQWRTAQVAFAHGVPYVFRPCGMLTRWSLGRKRLKKWLYLTLRLRKRLNSAAALHYTSELERQESLPLRPPAIVEPNGVSLAEFADLPARGAFRANHPAVGDRLVIAFLGRIHPGKGLEHLVPAVALLARRGLDPVLVVIGGDSGGFKATIDRAVAEHKIGDRVIFTGKLAGREKVEALVDADLFCLPSDHENFGIAVAEALAAGVPAVVSREVGIAPDLTAAGVGAAVSREPAALADELARWLADSEMRRAAASKARPFVHERYDWRQIAQRWAGHYERMMK
jgi:glycosyltransferase involved in cell wall biosynthesis